MNTIKLNWTYIIYPLYDLSVTESFGEHLNVQQEGGLRGCKGICSEAAARASREPLLLDMEMLWTTMSISSNLSNIYLTYEYDTTFIVS